jgi:hypothetical protein
MALRIIDGESSEMLAVGKLLHGSLQCFLRVPLEISLDIVG